MLSLFKSRGKESKPLKAPGAAGDIAAVRDRDLLIEVLTKRRISDPFPAIAPDVLVQHHSNLLADLYDNSGFDRESFDQLLMPLFVRLAEFTQLLPASEKHHHHSVCGLLQHSMEVCNIALRRAKGVSFCGSKQGQERSLDKARWPIGCAVSGLLHDIGKVAYDIIVRSQDGHHVWNPFQESLYEFALRENGYWASWRDHREHKLHELAGLSLIGDIIPKSLRIWMAEGDRIIVPVTLLAIAGHESPEHPDIYQVMHEADKESVKKFMLKAPEPAAIGTDRDSVAAAQRPMPSPPTSKQEQPEPAPSTGSNTQLPPPSNEKPDRVETSATKRLEQLLPELLSQRKWIVNQRDRERGLFWVDENSAWLSWPAFYTAVARQFEEDGFKSYPRVKGVFFDMLLAAGIVEKSAGEYTADVAIKQANGKTITLSMARIIDAALIAQLKRYGEQQVELTVKSELAALSEDEENAFVGKEGKPGDVVTIDLTSGTTTPKEPERSDSAAPAPAPAPAPVQTAENDQAEPDQQAMRSDLIDAPAEERAPAHSDTIAEETTPEPCEREAPAPAVTPVRQSLAEYIRSLNNDDVQWMRQQGEAGECLEEICSALAKGNIQPEDYGVLSGSLWLKWPEATKKLGEDEQQMLAMLMQAGFIRKISCTDFDIKASGIARISVKGKPKAVVALAKSTTQRMLAAYGFDKDFTLKLSPPVPAEPTIKRHEPAPVTHAAAKSASAVTRADQALSEPTNQKVKTPHAQEVNGENSSRPERNKQNKAGEDTDVMFVEQRDPPHRNTKKNRSKTSTPSAKSHKEDAPKTDTLDRPGYPVSEIFHALDMFVSGAFDRYSTMVFLHEQGIAFAHLSVIFQDACDEIPTLKTHWLARLKQAEGVIQSQVKTESGLVEEVDIVPIKFMRKTQKQLGKTIGGTQSEG